MRSLIFISFVVNYRHVFESVNKADNIYEGSREEIAHRRLLEDFKVMTTVPLLMFLKSPEGACDDTDYVESISVLESWVVRRAVMRYQTRSYGQIFRTVLNALIHAGAETPKAPIVRNVFASRGEVFSDPSDQEIINYFTESPVYGNGMISASRLRVFLGAIDHMLATRDNKGIRHGVDYDDLTVEHIMPQSWEEHWPLDSALEAVEEARQQRATLIQSFGNLTLLTQALNSSVSNGSWQTKLNGNGVEKGIREQTKIHLTQEIVDNPEWSETEILKRGKLLGERFVEVWPQVSSQV